MDTSTTALVPASRKACRQSDAVLLVLDVHRRAGNEVTPRLALERVALTVSREPSSADGSHVLSVFATDRRSCVRRLYESLAHLEQTGCVIASVEGYELTSFAETRMSGLEISDAEAARIAERLCVAHGPRSLRQ